jgi:acetyl esterase/lipase
MKLPDCLRTICCSLLMAVFCGAAIPQAMAQVTEPSHKDVSYATVNGQELRLDLYLPRGVANPPLIVWVHGGAWFRGSKADPPVEFVSSGFALASLDFRPSTESPFPGQVHEIKAAVRFLRAMASRYGYRSDPIAIAGASSGAHLATLVGVTSGSKELEGRVGGYFDQSSSVQAIVSYYGASNLTTILSQSTPYGVGVRVPALEQLLGGKPDAVPNAAKLASPVFHVDAADPPLLLFHGDQDPQMPINQSHELEGVYEQKGLKVAFEVVHGAAHGGSAFFDAKRLNKAVTFLRETLGK